MVTTEPDVSLRFFRQAEYQEPNITAKLFAAVKLILARNVNSISMHPEYRVRRVCVVACKKKKSALIYWQLHYYIELSLSPLISSSNNSTLCLPREYSRGITVFFLCYPKKLAHSWYSRTMDGWIKLIPSSPFLRSFKNLTCRSGRGFQFSTSPSKRANFRTAQEYQ